MSDKKGRSKREDRTDLAEDRTEYAEDRTMLANARAFVLKPDHKAYRICPKTLYATQIRNWLGPYRLKAKLQRQLPK